MNKPVTKIEPETREFSTAALASLSTGVLLCAFDEVQEAAEFLMGHPIWTHHFASKSLQEKMRDSIVRQHPAIPPSMDEAERANWQQTLADLEGRVGKRLRIARGSGETAMSPFDGIPDGKPVIVVKT